LVTDAFRRICAEIFELLELTVVFLPPLFSDFTKVLIEFVVKQGVFKELLRVPSQIRVNLETSGDEIDGGLVHAFESRSQVGDAHTWVRELLLRSRATNLQQCHRKWGFDKMH
jgi:hypothetical protein